MQLIINDRQYEMIMGSDVINDGMFLELNDITENNRIQILSAYFSDVDGIFTFWAYKEEIPFELVEIFVSEARRRLPPIKEK